MCGIAGIIDLASNVESLAARGNAMIDELYHRGPDGGDIWVDEAHGLVLGHRRLSIQDVSEYGAQPMFSASKRFVVVFNGEIYNFKELSAELSKLGHQFVGHSDTEVLLAAVEEWGLTDAVNKFVGMFAFALLDRKNNVMHLCRDRLGEKPLYYGWLGNSFYFASELKAIESVVSSDLLMIDPDGLADFLKHGYVSAPYSIYRNINKLSPGTVLSLPSQTIEPAQFSPWPDTAQLCPKTYWSVLNAAKDGLSDLISCEEDAVRELDTLLHRTVRQQMIADVKIGTFLSGGVDSTLVSAIAQSESSERVRTFTVGFTETEYDESVYAEKVARHLGTDHLTLHVTPEDALQVVPDLPSIYDEPFADSSQIPSYLVSKLAREHVTVCLSGDGGDELFAGYNRYLWTQSLWQKLAPVPRVLRQLLGKSLALPPPVFWDGLYHGLTHFKSDDFERQKLIGLKLQKLTGFMQQRDIVQAYDYLMTYWNSPEKIMLQKPSAELFDTKIDCFDAAGFVDHAMLLDQVGYLPGDNLAKVDRASMAVSLETRLPLLSHEMLELAWRVPVSMKLKANVSKSILRKVLYNYVPQEMIDRPKMGFSVPVAKWLRGELRVWAEALLANIDSSSGGLLQKEPILNAWDEHMAGKRDHSHRLWTILMFLAWAENRRFRVNAESCGL